jgi:GrpB-like predicted nucleotidyltransferase (UPF0157 family)
MKDDASYLDRVLIGGREKRAIVIADYDPSWPTRFARERERIRAALGAVALRIEHIGSTSVAGLAAKPIIDVLVTVKDPEDDPVLVPAFEAAGYALRVTEPAHRMFRTGPGDVHVHVWAEADPEVARVLAFRSWLRQHPHDCLAYERLKRALALREWEDMNDYAEAKSELIATILAKAGADATTATAPRGS